MGTVALIVYFLPRDGKFNYQFDINKPWKYGQLIATFDFPIYKEDAVVKREQDSLMAFFQPYYQLDKNIEKDAIAKLKEMCIRDSLMALGRLCLSANFNPSVT